MRKKNRKILSSLSLFLTYIYYEVNILLIYTLTSFFQPLLPDFRLITSCHITHYMNVVIGLFIIQEKEKQKKINIKLRKIKEKKRKEKMFKFKCTITLLESMILNRDSQFAVELTKELNRILEIEMRLSMAFYLQINGQTINKPRVGIILQVLCGIQTEGLIRVVSNGRVCSK